MESCYGSAGGGMDFDLTADAGGAGMMTAVKTRADIGFGVLFYSLRCRDKVGRKDADLKLMVGSGDGRAARQAPLDRRIEGRSWSTLCVMGRDPCEV